MEILIQTILFGKGIERLKTLYKFYLVIASFWIVNMILMSLNVNISKLLSSNNLIGFFFSIEGILSFFLFLFCWVAISYYGKILVIIGSYLIPVVFKMLMYIILVPKFILRLLMFKKIKNIFMFNQDDKIGMINESKKVPNFLNSMIAFNETDFNNSVYIFSFFSSMYIIFVLYHIDNLSSTLYIISLILCIFYFLNSSFLFFMMRKKEEFIKLIIKSELIENEHH